MFPLILSFSLGEKEPRAVASRFSKAPLANPIVGIRKRRRRILPLPRGEGRGENSPTTRSRIEPLNRPHADSSPSPGGEGWGEGELYLESQVHGEGKGDKIHSANSCILPRFTRHEPLSL